MSGRTRPQRAAARSLLTRSRTSACCTNAIRSAAAIKPWVGRTQAVGHRVIPFRPDKFGNRIAVFVSIFDQIIHVSHSRSRQRQPKPLAASRGFTEDSREDRNIGRASRRFPPSASTLVLSQSLVNGLVSKIFMITHYPQPARHGTKQERRGCFCGFERWRATRCNFKRGSARPSLLFFTEQRIGAGR